MLCCRYGIQLSLLCTFFRMLFASKVCLRSSPLYYPGAVGFITANGEPKVGELMEQAWTITEKCRFKILTKGNKDEKDDGNEREDKEDYQQPSGSTKSKIYQDICDTRIKSGVIL